MNERRAHQRFEVELEVFCFDECRRTSVPTRDVSLGGLFLWDRAAPDVGTRLELTFSLPDPHGSIRALGEVVHRPNGLGMGVRFLKLNEADRHRLADYLTTLEGSGPTQRPPQ